MADSYIYPAPNLTAGLSNVNSSALSTAQQILANPASSPDNLFWANQVMQQSGITNGASPSGAGVSALDFYQYPSTPTSAPTDNGLTVIGQDSAWLSPDELRAKTNALQSGLTGYGGGAGGSGGGGAGGGSAGTSGGLFSGTTMSGTSGQQPSGPQVGNFPSFGSSLPNGYLPNAGAPMSNVPGQTGQATGDQLAMMQSGPQNALNQYYNTAGYQLTNGQGAVNQFQTSPGYQFMMDQALRQVQQQGASRGLLDSGAGLRAMTDRAAGLANQEFNNWQQNQQNQYNQYQNRLQGLASGPVGSDMAYNLGQTNAGNAMQTGSNVGTLLANQGNSLFGGIVGAGGAQAQNVSNAGNMQAQILAGNLATQLAAASLGGR